MCYLDDISIVIILRTANADLQKPRNRIELGELRRAVSMEEIVLSPVIAGCQRRKLNPVIRILPGHEDYLKIGGKCQQEQLRDTKWMLLGVKVEGRSVFFLLFYCSQTSSTTQLLTSICMHYFDKNIHLNKKKASLTYLEYNLVFIRLTRQKNMAT